MRDDIDADRLRAAFRHGGSTGGDPRGVNADEFLARIHTGGRRRRVRRVAGSAVAAAAAVSIVVAGVTAVVADLEPAEPPVAQGPTSSSPPAGESTPSLRGELWPPPLAVYDLQVPDDRSVWALASPDCGRAKLCPDILHSTDTGQSWSTRSPAPRDNAVDDFRHLGVADNGRDLVVAGTGVATSHDAGVTWQPVDLAGDRPVRGVATGADEAVVVFEESGPNAVATSPVGSDDWAAADLPVSTNESPGAPFAGGDLIGVTVTSGDAPNAVALVVRSTGTDWIRADVPCESRTARVATDGASLWYLCFGGQTSVLATADVRPGGQQLSWTTTKLPAANDAGIGAWGDGTAVVATGKQVVRIDAGGSVQDLTDGRRGLTLTRDDYTVRATDKCWLTTFRGRLLHTPDDGRSWSRVRVELR